MTNVIKENLTKMVMQQLICGSCHELILPPVIEVCRSRHNVCSRCEPAVTKCPICKKRAMKKRNFDIENIVKTLDIAYPCCNRVFGCPEVSLYQNLPAHLSVCTYFSMKCPLESPDFSGTCSWKGCADWLKYHIMAMHIGYCVLVQKSEDDVLIGKCVDSKLVIFRDDKLFVLWTAVDFINAKEYFCIKISYFGPQHQHPMKYYFKIGIDCQKPKKFSFVGGTDSVSYGFCKNISYYKLKKLRKSDESISQIQYRLAIRKLKN